MPAANAAACQFCLDLLDKVPVSLAGARQVAPVAVGTLGKLLVFAEFADLVDFAGFTVVVAYADSH